ncbi:MAG: 4Fe-4S binding protein [Bacteroidales bacterium]|nr:4Fe-4S binding protein [Bacteroidales bacterium]
MLRRIRIVLAALSFIGLTLLFLGIGRGWWGFLPKLQLLPATLRLIGGATLGNAAVVLGIILLTLLAGRIYCSVLCPLGVFQDIIIWLRRTLGRIFPGWKAVRKRFSYNKERRWVRYPVAALMIASVIVDLQLVVSLLGPYSAYGRMVRSVSGGGPAPLLVAAGVTFVAIVLCAWCWGRAYCNTVCPVGTVLGCVSKFQLFGVRVDKSKCVNCGACSRACKASCIEEGSLKIDYSRCVDCFDCIRSCKQGAISFGFSRSAAQEVSPETFASLHPSHCPSGPAGPSRSHGHGRPWFPETPPASAPREKPDASRRQFIATAALLLGTGIAAGAQEMKVDGGLARLEAKKALEREPRLVPPGAQSVKNFYDKCTACQLCIAHCPNGVLRASTDLEHLLQPQMGYENGYCRPECTACSEVCPSGAILPVKRDAKTLIHIGTAVVNPDLCLAAKGEARCGKCAGGCPTGAIIMVDCTVDDPGNEAGGVGGNAPRPLGVQGDSKHSSAKTGRRPIVAEEECIGCGKCEYLCPARPVSAVTVKGMETHRNG